MNRLVAWAAAGSVVAAAGGAVADPRLDEKVYAPYVEKGVGEIEVRTGGEVGSGALSGDTTTVIEAEYGFSDRINLAVLTAVAHAAPKGTRFSSVGLEAIGYLGQISVVGVDTAVYLEYGHGLSGEQDVFEAKALLAKNIGRFQGLVNLIVEKPLNGPPGERDASYGYAVSGAWRMIGNLRVGVEALGDLGSQGAYVGPQIKWKVHPRALPAEIELDAGWLAPVGVTRYEARSQLKLVVELEHRF